MTLLKKLPSILTIQLRDALDETAVKKKSYDFGDAKNEFIQRYVIAALCYQIIFNICSNSSTKITTTASCVVSSVQCRGFLDATLAN